MADIIGILMLYILIDIAARAVRSFDWILWLKMKLEDN